MMEHIYFRTFLHWVFKLPILNNFILLATLQIASNLHGRLDYGSPWMPTPWDPEPYMEKHFVDVIKVTDLEMGRLSWIMGGGGGGVG